MAKIDSVTKTRWNAGGGDLFERIGRFLTEQGLSPDPEHYRFAHAIVSNPDGPIAKAVGRLVNGGARLSRADIEGLGGRIVDQAGLSMRHKAAIGSAGPSPLDSDTRDQVEGFAEMVRTVYDETRLFGRDLAASAAAFDAMPQINGLDEIARLAGTMIARVHDAEVRLSNATSEAETLREKLAEAWTIARRDDLTGLPNRRAFEEAFYARGADEAPYALALCDIDRFKRINDGFGHPVGDRVLAAVAHSLSQTYGDQFVARHGGEEFVVLLRGVTLPQGVALVEEARAAVAGKRFRDRESGAKLGSITVSAGVTAIVPGDTMDAALERVDQLLYRAKAEGRNRVCVA
ncbi:MAG TPA: GGDEF domain-containing protein [Sphingomonas sp.]|nr:GGDEF domain-containing protein [Sphingomonas sp.]